MNETPSAERDATIAQQVLRGETLAAVAQDCALGKKRVREIVLNWCARSNPRMFTSFQSPPRSPWRHPPPALATLRAHAYAFGIEAGSVGNSS